MGLRALAAEFLPSALQGLQRLPSPSRDSFARKGAKAGEAAQAPPEVSTFAALEAKLGYLPKADFKQVREAYRFADAAHLGQFRADGQPYITHPIAVTALVAEWRLDAQALMAALLHDTMEDQGVTKAELIEHFGAPTAELVDGLTKLDKVHFSTREQGQAENFRKMLMAMSRDVRVILVKLADRLHNVRTLGALSPERQQRIARETLDIYAPIAHRLGLNLTYRELQERSFQMLSPWRYRVLNKALTAARGQGRDVVERVQQEVERAFGQHKVKVEVSGREKTVHSLYRKMRSKHASFAQVTDLFGFRVVVPQLTDCYLALGILHQLYKPVPGRFKDYIAIPKANGYQSLHTTLVSPLGTPVEFQMRTPAMHAVAESGIAAHWLYKSRGGKADATTDAEHLLSGMWLQSLLDIQDETRDSAEFLEHVKIDLHPEAVYVFTPKSRILALPRGATPVDFAYAIHSDVGQHMVAAKVNGQAVALRTELRSGDVVEVVTAPGARPNPAWLGMARTGRARSKIRQYLKNLEADESRGLGEKMLAQALRAEGLAMPSIDPTDTDAAALWQQLAKWAGNRNRGDLLIDLSMGRKVATIVAKRLAQLLAERGVKPDALSLSLGRYAHDDEQAISQAAVVLDGQEGGSIQLATCCRPIPGDEITGYLGRGEGLTVHLKDCSSAKRLFERDHERWMPVDWADDVTRPYETRVNVAVFNGKGVLAQVATAVSSAEADITHVDMDAQEDSAELRLMLSVRDRVHLADVLRAVRRLPAVQRVARHRAS